MKKSKKLKKERNKKMISSNYQTNQNNQHFDPQTSYGEQFGQCDCHRHENAQVPYPGGQNAYPTQHSVPKCTCCGHEGPWKVDPVFRPVDWILTILFLLLGILPGVVYATTIILIRGGKRGDHYRAKTCPKCGAKNLFTFLY